MFQGMGVMFMIVGQWRDEHVEEVRGGRDGSGWKRCLWRGNIIMAERLPVIVTY